MIDMLQDGSSFGFPYSFLSFQQFYSGSCQVSFDIHVYIHSVPLDETKLDKILSNQEKMMSKADELKAELVAANEVTNELAADVDDLLKRVGEGSLTAAEADEVKTQLTALKERLTGVAAVHTPTSPT